MKTLTAFLMLTSVTFAQTAVYNGRIYTPESYVRGANYMYPNCPMCNNIRAQWQAQGWISGYGANKQMRQTSVAQDEKKPTKAKVEHKTETRYRTVTKYRTVTYQERQCFIGPLGRRSCQMVTRTKLVPYQAKEAYKVIVGAKEPEPTIEGLPPPIALNDISNEPDATPQDVVDAMLAVMELDATDTLWDIGSGRDARFLVTACRRYGCRGVGIEINEDHAKASRRLIEDAGLSDQITIITADALKPNVSLGAARKVVVYQYPDVQKEIIARLAFGTLVGCYSHRPETIDAKLFRSDGHQFFVGVK